MIFTDIRLQNFRSYRDGSFELESGVNIVVGPNAAGKTNLLEAILLCSVGRSFRAKDGVLVMSGEKWARIDIHTSDNKTRVVKIKKEDFQKPEKLFQFEEKTYKKMVDEFIQPAVLFEPTDMNLIHSEPSVRRDFLDKILEQIVPGYSKLRVDLRRILAQRNALLKTQPKGESQLFAWDVRLCDVASKIIEHRTELVDEINQEINQTYKSISDDDKSVSFIYISKTSLDNYSSSLMKQLEDQRELDLMRGYTSRGPHRDDIVAYFKDDPLEVTASRGENRTFILALKIIELRILEKRTSIRPLLLLDDVFSELDSSRRRALTDYLKDYQTIITTTDADAVIKNFSSGHNLIALG